MGKERALRNAFWRELGAGSFALVLGAVFFPFASLGFLVDILTLSRFSIGQLIYTTLVAGGVSSLYVWCATRGLKWLPAAIGVQIVLLLLSPILFSDAGPLTDPHALRRRLTLDSVGIIVCIAVGYTLF